MIKIVTFLFLTITLPLKANSILDIYDHSTYQGVKISPDGKHLAISVYNKNKVALAFIERKTNKVVGSLKFDNGYDVGDYHWASNTRVVAEMVKKEPWLEAPQHYGELFAVNFNGNDGALIYGYRAGQKSNTAGSRIKQVETTYGWGEIVDVLPEDDKHIIITSTPMDNKRERIPKLLKLNIYNGISIQLASSPIAYGDFVISPEGEVAAVTGVDADNQKRLYLRKGNDWKEVDREFVGDGIHPISVDSTGQYLYTLDNFKQDKVGFFRLNTQTLENKSLFTDKTVDITTIATSPNNRSAYIARIDNGFPAYLTLSAKIKEAQVFKKLLNLFPYTSIRLTSSTSDGKYFIASIASDNDPGAYYLYNNETDKVTLLFQRYPGHNSANFVQTEPVKITTNDKKVIHGYFTPAKTTKKVSPAVILVHGGPKSRDYWHFDKDVQFLTANGFSVLQINFRGSSGYGTEYEIAGDKNWGRLIQEDIYAGYNWLVQQGKSDKNNVCIMGTSFGGYSAVQSLVKYPDTYKCAVANAGIYDLALMFEKGDIQTRRSGSAYLKQALGTDQNVIRAMSPIHHVNKIKAPILLAHGEKDERAPIEHAIALKKALDQENKPYIWYSLENEEHGFFNPENQKAYMTKVVNFLNEHLKK